MSEDSEEPLAGATTHGNLVSLTGDAYSFTFNVTGYFSINGVIEYVMNRYYHPDVTEILPGIFNNPDIEVAHDTSYIDGWGNAAINAVVKVLRPTVCSALHEYWNQVLGPNLLQLFFSAVGTDTITVGRPINGGMLGPWCRLNRSGNDSVQPSYLASMSGAVTDTDHPRYDAFALKSTSGANCYLLGEGFGKPVDYLIVAHCVGSNITNYLLSSDVWGDANFASKSTEGAITTGQACCFWWVRVEAPPTFGTTWARFRITATCSSISGWSIQIARFFGNGIA